MKNTIICRTLAFVLALFIILSFNSFAFAAESIDTPDGFHTPTILRMIESNLATDNPDEEFFHNVANAYLADPLLFIEIISDYSSEEQEYLARGIAYDLYKTNRNNQVVIPEGCDTQELHTIANLIYTQARNPENSSLSIFAYDEAQNMIANYSARSGVLLGMVVETPVLSASQTDVFNTVQVTVSVRSTTTDTVDRMVSVALYKTDGTTSSSIRHVGVTIPAGENVGTLTRNITFNQTGVYTVYAKLLDSSMEPVWTSHNSSSITVRGSWHITVVLPTNRIYKGTITLYNASGTAILTAECLGLAEGNGSMYVEGGNTPTGEYTGTLEVCYGSTFSYGPYKVIDMTGVSGAIIESGRDGIWIHGGDPSIYPSTSFYPFRPTGGCVRVTNETQLQLQNLITGLIESAYHYQEGTISITEES